MPSWGRDSRTDVPSAGGPDYQPLPPPHRLSTIDDPYALTLSNSPRHSTTDLRPSPSPHSSYVPVEHADAAMSNNVYSYRGYSNVDAPYSSNQAFNSSNWQEKERASSRRKKAIVIGSVVVLILLVAGIVVGVVVAKNNNKKTTDHNDPSTFVANSNLKKSFFGIAYTPENSQFPDCGNKLEDVITDIQLLSQLTSQIRLYGADCNQSALVLEAIKQTKTDMTVWLGNYPIPTDPAPYERQRDAIIDTLKTYGTDHVSGITVGNEYMLNWLNANGATEPNSAIGNVGAQMLLSNITDTRNAVSALNLPNTLPIGTADAGSFFSNEVLAGVDYGMSNIHAWFANVSADASAAWVNSFFQETNVAAAAALPNNPKMYIAETGWPTGSKDVGNESNGPSNASEANLQVFLDTFVCQANSAGTGYFFFEYADEMWKDAQFGGVEGHWGLFYPNRTLKAITIPTCS